MNSTIRRFQFCCHMASAGFFLMLLTGSWPALAMDVKTVVSPGGIRALLVEDHSNPVIAMRMAFRGGSALDPEAMGGLTNLVSAIIDEGAGPLDSQAFQARLERLSVRLNFSTTRDNFRGSLTTLTKNRDEAIELLRLALTQPRFDREPVERIRSQVLAGLRRETQDPDSVAAKSLFRLLFGSHPYARPRTGTVDSVRSITAAAMAAFVNERFARDNLVIGVTGDITADDLGTVLDRAFGSLPATAAPWQVDMAPLAFDGGIHVDDVAVSQSAILFAQRGLDRSHRDFYAAHVLNYILGGGTFVSRLYNQVREQRGLAYSIHSHLSAYDHAALLLGGTGTANASVAETIQVIRDQWRIIQQDGVSADEVRNAKTYLTGSYPLRFSSSGDIAGMLMNIQLHHLGADHFDRRNGYIEAVTQTDVNRLARTLLDPDSLTFVVAGQPDGVLVVQ